jgi:hypothetical protein
MLWMIDSIRLLFHLLNVLMKRLLIVRLFPIIQHIHG